MQGIPVIACLGLQVEDPDETSEGGLIRTCHLCGKAQCGQRRGRVRCTFCKRIFCTQQLNKKYKIKASTNDIEFKCPRCLGLCCCVTNCQKPPPHIHCKVYKVRQNKRRNRELLQRENAESFAMDQATRVNLQMKQEYDNPIQSSFYSHENPQQPSPHPPLQLQIKEICGISYPDSIPSNSFYYHSEIPGIQHSDWLTQLNLRILDGGDNSLQFSGMPQSETECKFLQKPLKDNQFVDKLRYFINNRLALLTGDRIILQNELAEDAYQLQIRADKSDVVLKLIDSFNRNTIHATITWRLTTNRLEPNQNNHAIPALFTIVNCCPTVLFSLETNTSYDERGNVSSVSITYFNTSAIKDICSLCTCISLMNNSFQHYSDIKDTESWTESSITWKKGDNIDVNLLKTMNDFGENARRALEGSTSRCRIVISYSRCFDDHSFENLPILSLVLKKVSTDYPSAVYVLERMMCDERNVVCVLLFSEDRNWVKIINAYESTLEVCREENCMMMNRVNSTPLFLDL